MPSDPWMAQVGGVDNLSPFHSESARKSYENWEHKEKYDFRNYVDYVQRQWENKELPPPGIPAPQAIKPPQSKYIPDAHAKQGDWTDREAAHDFNQQNPQAEPQRPKKKWLEPELYKLRQEIWQQQVFEMGKHAEANAAEYKQADEASRNADPAKLEDFDSQQREARQGAEPAPKTGWRAALDRILTTDEDREKKAAEQREQAELLEARQAQERLDYLKKLEQDRQHELAALRERQLREQAEREKAFDADLDRHLREKKRALELQRELEAEEREKELNRENEEGLGEGKE